MVVQLRTRCRKRVDIPELRPLAECESADYHSGRCNHSSGSLAISLGSPSTNTNAKLVWNGQVWYDDAVSSEAKFAAVKKAGWRGLGFWQASGMWPGDTEFFSPYDNVTDVSVYCKKDIQEMWTMVGKYF